jgi:hypothetical protein
MMEVFAPSEMTLVHDVAAELIRSLRNGWPDFAVDQDAVLFGASIHDIGKVMHPNELGPGHDHEQDGPPLPTSILPQMARIAAKTCGGRPNKRCLSGWVALLSVPASRLPLSLDGQSEGEHDD